MTETIYGWNKMPSVRTGGKPYFYTKLKENIRYCVVWNRGVKKWEATKSDQHFMYLDNGIELKRFLKLH
jgi:hypothetical protein